VPTADDRMMIAPFPLMVRRWLTACVVGLPE